MTKEFSEVIALVILILFIILFVGSFIETNDLGISTGAQDIHHTITTRNDRPLRIIRPCMAIPDIRLKGDHLTIWVDCLGATESSLWRARLLTDHELMDLTINGVTFSDGYWYLSALIPDTTGTDLYSLEVTADGSTGLEYNAICIRETFPDNFTFVHMTDTHVNNESFDQVQQCFREINLIHPDFVLITGDLVHESCPEQYEMLIELIRELRVPAYLVMGNHDYTNLFGFNNDPIYYLEYITPIRDYSFDFGNHHFVGMDSGHTVDWPYNTGSGFTDEQMRWLEGDLWAHRQSRSRFIFMHHPAVDFTGLTIKNNREEFIALSEEYGVDMTLSGHTHWDAVYDKNGNKKEGDVGWVNGTKFLQTTASGMKSPLYAFAGYRLLRVASGELDTYTYDYDANGARDAASSIPYDNIDQSYFPSNNGTADRMAVRIKNDLRESFHDACLELKVTEPGKGLGYVAENGTIVKEKGSDDIRIFSLRTDIEALSITEISLYQVDIYAPVVTDVVSEENGIRKEIYGGGARVRILVFANDSEENLSGSISITSATDGGIITKNTLTELAGGIYYYDWDTDNIGSGDYEVETTLTDNAGNIDGDGMREGADLVVRIDATPPVLTEIFASVGADRGSVFETGADIGITAMASGNEPGLFGTVTIMTMPGREIMAGCENLTEMDEGGYRYTWSTVGLGCGEYEIRITFRDRCGNERVLEDPNLPDLVIELVDTTPPVVGKVWASESEGGGNQYNVGNTVTIYVEEMFLERTLEGLVEISFPDGTGSLSGELTESNSPGIYVYEWNTTSLSAGDHWVEIVLADQWGNRDADGLSTSPDLVITLLDVTSPEIRFVEPRDGAENIGVDTVVTVGFDELIHAYSFPHGFQLKDGTGRTVRGNWRYDKVNDTFEFTPQEHLVHNRTYHCSLLPEVRDLSGNEIRGYFNWSFRTEPTPLTNSAPRIIGYIPYATTIYSKPGDSINFSVEVLEEDPDTLDIRWYANGVMITNESEAELQLIAPPAPNGTVVYRTISVEVSDGEFTAVHIWMLIVSDSGTGPEEVGDGDEGTKGGNFLGLGMGKGIVLIMGLVLIGIVLLYIVYRRKRT